MNKGHEMSLMSMFGQQALVVEGEDVCVDAWLRRHNKYARRDLRPRESDGKVVSIRRLRQKRRLASRVLGGGGD
jgi:hypothetical protein